MKLLSVSLLLALVTACKEEPFAPVPGPPRLAPQDGPVVITGRVVSSASTTGQLGANVRVTEARASVGTDETGRYRIVVPAGYRGHTVSLSVRAIGFKVQNRTVRLDRDTVALDVAMAVDTVGISCDLVIISDPYGKFTEQGFTSMTRAHPKLKKAARSAK